MYRVSAFVHRFSWAVLGGTMQEAARLGAALSLIAAPLAMLLARVTRR